MADRKDALVAASRFIAQVPEVVKANGNDYTVATVGTIKVQPNSVNVVPEAVPSIWRSAIRTQR